MRNDGLGISGYRVVARYDRRGPSQGIRGQKGTKTKRSVTARLPTFSSVRDEIRTHTSQRPLPPQSSVSTNSTTRTYGISSLILVPRTGLEPACLSTHAPETCASTNSATWAYTTERYRWSEKRDSNPRPQPWQGCALPTELFSHFIISKPFSERFPMVERKTGLEPATPTLARLCSTN